MHPRTRKRWFSIIIVMLIVGFLIVLSTWVLTLVIQENKNTRLVYNSVATYAWAEWALEYSLLKVKNHQEWFSDSIDKTSWDYDVNLLSNNPDSPSIKDESLEYEMLSNSKKYDWTIDAWWFEVIPLFYDEWIVFQNTSKNPNMWTSHIIKTHKFKLTSPKELIWNIIWNDVTWDTFWITWTWWLGSSVWTWSDINISFWSLKKNETDTNLTDDSKMFSLEKIDIGSFMDQYDSNYLIINNPSNEQISYSIESPEGFSTPKIAIVWSSRIWNYKQNVSFEEDKSKIFDILKYSLINN